MRYSPLPLLLCVILIVPPVNAAAADDTTWPWQLLSGQFGGTPHSLGYSPHASQTSGGPDMGAFFMGGDDGGVWRSLDCGASWAPVNGGPAMSNGINGGYLNEPNVCTDPAGHCTHGIHYGGALSMGTDVSFPSRPAGHLRA